MNSLQKLAESDSFYGYMLDTGRKGTTSKRKRLKEQGFNKVDKDTYQKERKGPLNVRHNKVKKNIETLPARGSVAGGTLGAGLTFLASKGSAKTTAIKSLGGLAAGAALGGLTGLGASNKLNKKLESKRDLLNKKMDGMFDAKMLRIKGDPEFYIKTAGFKEASVASKLFKAFPNSKTLERASTRQVVKAQQKGNTARRNVIRGDMDAVQKMRNPKTPDMDTGIMDIPKPNVGSDKVPKSAFGLDALKNRKRDMYMLAGGAALGGGAGYALGNSNSQ